MTPGTGPDLSRQRFILPADAKLIPLNELSPRMRATLGCRDGGEGQVAVSRPGLRVATRLITPHLAALLSEFREPSLLTDAVLRFSRARSMDPFATLDDAFDALALLVNDRLLVSADSLIAGAIVPTLAAGQLIAEYEVDRLVSSLEDTEVYRAITRAGKPVAVKLARPGASEAVLHCLTREARILDHLCGRHAPSLIEHAGDAAPGGRSFVAMEWRPGVAISVAAHQARTSHDRRRQHRLCGHVLSAYAWLHERGIVHGDVHPGNIVVGDDDAITILDFGRSRFVPVAEAIGDARHVPDLALPEAMRAGVPYFYEPEIAKALQQGVPLPPATTSGEQYSLSALLYYLLTGVHYADLSPEYAVLLAQITERSPLPFTARGLEPWPHVEAVLATALSKDRAARFPTVAHFRDAFESDGAKGFASAGPSSQITAASRLLKDCLHIVRCGWDGTGREAKVATAHAFDLAWFAHRAAQARDDPGLLADADVWACRAHSAGNTAWQVDAVTAEIDRARGEPGAQIRSVNSFLRRCEGLAEDLDYLGGRSGALAAASRLFEAGATSEINSPNLGVWMRDTVEKMWQRLDEWLPLAECVQLPHLGMAHGWAGVLFSTLHACRAIAMPPPVGMAERLEQLAMFAQPSGRGVCWPGTLPHAEVKAWTPSMAPGWCSGSAGHVWLWALADEQFADPRFRRLAERAGWDAVDQPASNPDFCCGTTGRGFALLRLYQLMGAAEWLAHAQRLAQLAAAQWHERPGSIDLRTGSLGTALLIAELEAPERAVLPIFGPTDTPRRVHAALA